MPNQIEAVWSKDFRDLNAHPETATGRDAIWLQRFKRKFSFFRTDAPFMLNTGLARVFRFAPARAGSLEKTLPPRDCDGWANRAVLPERTPQSSSRQNERRDSDAEAPSRLVGLRRDR